MKNIVIMVEKYEENKELLAIKLINKIVMMNFINLSNKYIGVISNAIIDVAKDLKLIHIKKYQSHTS